MASASDSNDDTVSLEMNRAAAAKPFTDATASDMDVDPPTYEEAVDPDIPPPPSYESLFGQVKEARRSSRGIIDFMLRLFVLLLGTVGYSVIIAAAIAVPIAMIVMGSVYMYQCPQGENIPLCMLVGGLLGVFKELLHLSENLQKDAEAEAERKRNKPAHSLLFWFLVGWFLLGSIWVYELTEPNYDPERGLYCNKALYLFAFWLVTSVYIVLGFITFCVCSLAVTTFWWWPDDESSDSE